MISAQGDMDELLRPLEPSPALLALNNAHAVELSWLEPERFAHMVAMAFLARQVGEDDGFLLTFDQDAAYDSPNFLWLKARYERFVYVDRVVVAGHARGRGLAGQFYKALFEAAAKAGHTRIVCEVNSDPPNLASDAFHEKLGFEPIGEASLDGGKKTVRYLMRTV
jgi:predicted GNAT superfamily acetyltransferase